MVEHIVLSHARAPGDVAVMTALVRDIALTRPGEFKIDVITPTARSLWDFNPYITHFRDNAPPNTKFIRLDYGAGLREQRYETIHFLNYFHRNFEIQTRWKIALQQPWPDLHLSATEKAQRPVADRYWVCVPGGKTDFTAKLWAASRWSDLVSRLATHGLACVQVGATGRSGKYDHVNPLIPEMSLSLVGKTNLRELLQLIHHAEGVICGNTAAMHFAAALHKPCVVLGGGREAWYWYGYVPENRGLGGLDVARQLRVPHRVLHTVGLLDCCQNHGCWKSHTVPLGESQHHCMKPLAIPEGVTPICMDMISAVTVETAVLSYYLDGTLTWHDRLQQGGKDAGVQGQQLSADREQLAVPA